uniref:Reverse transcriptase domain-containing protein n=1 Tax=Megaselia scalaris TaxID=36166 RepID=T1GJX8_MEGSC
MKAAENIKKHQEHDYNKFMQILGYADYIDVVRRTTSSVASVFQGLEKEAKSRGLRVIADKTKCMLSRRNQSNHESIFTIGDYDFESTLNAGSQYCKADAPHTKLRTLTIMSCERLKPHVIKLVGSYKCPLMPDRSATDLMSFKLTHINSSSIPGKRLLIIVRKSCKPIFVPINFFKL